MELDRRTINAYQEALQRATRTVDMTQIGSVAFIGSGFDGNSPGDAPHDIDVIALPSLDAKGPGAAYLAMVQLFDEADRHFAKHGVTARTPLKHLQPKTEWFTRHVCGTPPINIHTLCFSDKDSFYRINPTRFVDYCRSNHQDLAGSFDDALMTMPEKNDEIKLEALAMVYQFDTMQQTGKIPNDLLREENRTLLRYFEKIYGVRIGEFKTADDAHKALRELILAIDTESLGTIYTRGDWTTTK